MVDPSNFTPPYDDHLCAALGAAGFDVTLYARPVREHEAYSRSNFTLIEHFHRTSERLYRFRPLRPVYRYVKVLEYGIDLLRLQRVLSQARPDIIHFQWSPLPVMDSWFLPGLRCIAPLVLTVHNTKPFHGNPSSSLQALGWRKILHAFDRLIVHTEQSRQQLLSVGCPEAKLVVIPHGPLQKHGGNESAREKANDTHTAPRRQILFFGNIKPYKGVDVLLKAYSLVPIGARQDSRIVIAGRSSLPTGELERLSAELGIQDSVEFDLRFLSDAELARLLERADMVIFPYRDIDASGALMLALPYGKPVIASRLGIFSEILEDEKTALLVGVDDHQALARAIERVLTDRVLAARLGEGARQVAADYPSWPKIAQLTASTYQSLLSTAARTEVQV